jgi:NAD(P)-dependent dehydrogenase (short-subunit alcohol dehydrogenase family)
MWDRVLRLNLTGTFRVCDSAWPHLIAAGGGAIVNMSSLAAVIGISHAMLEAKHIFPSASYGVAKAGIEAFTRYIAKGPGTADDVANTVRFLASEEARFITAEIINIDGGAAAKL